MRTFSASTALALAFMVPAPGGRAAEQPPQRTILESAYAEFWTVEDETFFVFKSDANKRVTLTGTNLRIVCDHLEMTAVGISDKDKPDAKGVTLPTLEKFKYLLATGDVHIVQGAREATAGRVEVFPREDKLELTESPVVTDHSGDRIVNGVVDHGLDQVGSGTKITMFRGEQKVIIENSKFEAPPIRDLGFEKKSSAPAAPPAVTVPGLPPSTKQ